MIRAILAWLQGADVGIDLANAGRVLMVRTVMKIDCEGNDRSQREAGLIVRGQ